jgi:hypothetical protein
MKRLERENQALKLVLVETMLELDKKKTKIAKRLSKRDISKLFKISRKGESPRRQHSLG